MATLTKTTSVCDVCKSTRRQVKRYRVAQDGTLVAVDLCSEHGAYLEKLLKLGERVPHTSPRVKLWTPEEIEAEKKRQRRNSPPQ